MGYLILSPCHYAFAASGRNKEKTREREIYRKQDRKTANERKSKFKTEQRGRRKREKKRKEKKRIERKRTRKREELEGTGGRTPATATKKRSPRASLPEDS